MKKQLSHEKALREKIRKVFGLAKDIHDGFDCRTLAALDEASCDNVALCNPDRKSDMALILYSFLGLVKNQTDQGRLHAFDLLLLHLMPSCWNWSWPDASLRNAIEPFLEIYTEPEAETVLEWLQYIAPLVRPGDEQSMLNEVTEYWDAMAHRRETLAPTERILREHPIPGLHWNRFLETAREDG